MKEAKKPEVETVFLNRGVKRATGEQIKPNTRPDVTSVTKDGKVNQFEVPFKTDKIPVLEKRMETTTQNFSQDKQGKNKVIEIKKLEGCTQQ